MGGGRQAAGGGVVILLLSYLLNHRPWVIGSTELYSYQSDFRWPLVEGEMHICEYGNRSLSSEATHQHQWPWAITGTRVLMFWKS